MLDVLLVNANVLTMDAHRPVAQRIGIWRGRIVGVDEQVATLPARRTVDLNGATVLPGFVDAHVHLVWAGMRAAATNVAPCERVEDVLAIIGAAAARHEPGGWVDVVGYDQRQLGRHLTAAELDAAAGARRKVFVMHDSGHACVVNGAVLALLPPGVEHADGVLTERGMAAVRRLRQPYPLTEIVDAVERAARTCLAEGVTACAEAGIGGGLVSHSPVELAAYQRAHEQGRLPIRVQLMVAADALRPAGAHHTDGIPRAIDLGMRTGFGGHRLSIGAMKVFTDGAMMPRTAALTSPYAGTSNTGQLYADPAELTALIIDGHRAGWQLAVHAIGDRAIDLTLAALAEAHRRYPRHRTRHRIEHAGLVRPDQLAAFAATGATAVVQPNFLWYLGDDYAEIMGPARAPWLYRGRAFLDHRVPLAGSSDRPVTAGAPLRSIQFMVERLTRSGRPLGADEAITAEQALRAFTRDSAHACGWDDAGTIAAGNHADLVLLADDPTRVEPSRIAGIAVLATAVAGEIAHGTPLW
jgi:predicted amidohydrolase YtcJ